MDLSTSLFGYDIFISYVHADSFSYSERLMELLEKKDNGGFKCFKDVKEGLYGKELTKEIRRGLHKSSTLLLIGTKGVINSEDVLKEIRIFSQLKKSPFNNEKREIILIETTENIIFNHLPELKKRVWIDEQMSFVNSGEVRNEIINKVNLAFKARKTRTKRSQFLSVAILTFLLLGFTAFNFWKASESSKVETTLALERESLALKRESVAKDSVEVAKGLAKLEREKANNAEKQRGLAEDRAKLSEKQKRFAEFVANEERERRKAQQIAQKLVDIGSAYLKTDPAKSIAFAREARTHAPIFSAALLLEEALLNFPESRQIHFEQRENISEIEVLPSNFYGIRDANFLHGGDILLIHHYSGELSFWDVQKATKISSVDSVTDYYIQAGYPPTIYSLLSGGELKKSILYHNGKLGNRNRVVDKIVSLHHSLDYKTLTVLDKNDRLRLIDGEDLTKKAYPIPSKKDLLSLDLSFQGEYLTTLDSSWRVRIINILTGEIYKDFEIEKFQIQVPDFQNFYNYQEKALLIREQEMMLHRSGINFSDLLKMTQDETTTLESISSTLDLKFLKEEYSKESEVRVLYDERNELVIAYLESRYISELRIYDLNTTKKVWEIKRPFSRITYHPATFKFAILDYNHIYQFAVFRNLRPENVDLSQADSTNLQEYLISVLKKQELLIDTLGLWNIDLNLIEVGRAQEVVYSKNGEYLLTINAPIMQSVGPANSTVKLWYANSYTDPRVGDVNKGRKIGVESNTILNGIFDIEGENIALFATNGSCFIYEIFPEKAISNKSRVHDFYNENSHEPLYSRYLEFAKYTDPSSIDIIESKIKVEVNNDDRELINSIVEDTTEFRLRKALKEIDYQNRVLKSRSAALQNDSYKEIKEDFRPVPPGFFRNNVTYSPLVGNPILLELLNDIIKDGGHGDIESIERRYYKAVKKDLFLITGFQSEILESLLNSEDLNERMYGYILSGLTGDLSTLGKFEKAVQFERMDRAKELGKFWIDYLKKNGRDLSIDGPLSHNPEIAFEHELISLPTSILNQYLCKLLLPFSESQKLELPWSTKLIEAFQLYYQKTKPTLVTLNVLNKLTGVEGIRAQKNFVILLRDEGALDQAIAWGKYFISLGSYETLTSERLDKKELADFFNIVGYLFYRKGPDSFNSAIDYFKNSEKFGKIDGWPVRNIGATFYDRNLLYEAEKYNRIALDQAIKYHGELEKKYETYRESDNFIVEQSGPKSDETKELEFNLRKSITDLPGFYNELAWVLIINEGYKNDSKIINEAHELAGIALSLSQEIDRRYGIGKPHIIDTYAHTLVALGKIEEAIEFETAAFRLSGDIEYKKKIEEWNAKLKGG